MMRNPLRIRMLACLTVGLFILGGCQGPQKAQPVTTDQAGESQTQPEPQPQKATPTPEEGVSFFGQRPGAPAPENRILTNMTQHTFSAVGRDFDPDLDPTGKVIVFASTRNSEHPDIFMKHVDGYAITQLTSDPADDIQPRFSPDGKSVVFASNRAGNWDIWLVNTDGTGLTQLTSTRTDEVAPCFSPDGKQVAFTVWGRQSHQWEIWVLAVDRPGVKRFLCYGMFPDWSPDGKRIAFQRARQRGTRWFSVWSIELVGDEARHPTELAYSDSHACIAPRWSPDGKTIAYCAVQPNSMGNNDLDDMLADIWTVDAQTGMKLRITDGAVAAFNPTWSPSGRIYFVSARSGVENVWSLSTSESPARQTLALQRGPSDQQRRPAAAAVNQPLSAEGK